MDKEEIAHPLKGLENPDIPFLRKLEWVGIKPGLERINWLLKILGNPEKKYMSIIVGGTNGKGSVASILYSILIHNGYRCGLYTSPHLVSVCERFRTENGFIRPEEFRSTADEIIKKVGEDELITMGVTYFEFTTALAFKWFAEKKIDIAVLEVGMGGRLDATNSAPAILSIITSVSKDHTHFLGKTIEKIAFEKAGIIKKNNPVITASNGSALRVIHEQSIKMNAPLYIFGKDFNISNKNGRFDYLGLNRKMKNLFLNLSGSHQRINASLALAGAEILENFGFSLNNQMVRRALRGIPLSGRFEIVRTNPFVVIDGAHNPSAIKIFVNTLKEVFPQKKYYIIFGAMKDKDIRGMLRILEKVSDDFYISAIPVERAERPENIKKYFMKKVNALCFENIASAYKSATERTEKNDVICVTGSFYLVGEFLKSA